MLNLRAMTAHPGARWAFFGWSGFIAENVVLSHNREIVIREIGNENYHLLYNTLSTLACASIGYGLFRFRSPIAASRMWSTRGTKLQGIAFCLQAIGLVGFSQAAPRLQVPFATAPTPEESTTSSSKNPLPTQRFHARCPFDFHEKHEGDGTTARGLKRITRHPMLWSLGALGAGAAVVTPYPAQVVAYSMPLLFALIGGAHKDYRYRRNWGGFLSPELDATTSNVPFVAVLAGKQSLASLAEEMKWINASVAVTIALALLTRRLRC
eukprot:g1735.t1